MRRKSDICEDPRDRGDQGVTYLDQVKDPVRACPKPVPGSDHDMDPGEPEEQGAEEYKTGEEVRVDNMVGNVVKPEKYPAQRGHGRSAVSSEDDFLEIFPVVFPCKCTGIDNFRFHSTAIPLKTM